MPPSLSMSSTSVQDPPAQELPSGSGQTLPSRPLQPLSESSASKRVCFYKSGDHKFSGHRMVITARSFKTFDALLDALSKKVPLPFGVRTITTPRGTHLVKALEDLQDGGAYVCSDQKRVKPLNLDEVNRRQVPWNTTRLLSAGRRRRQGLQFGQFGRGNDGTSRPVKVTERVAVRTPKKLVVIKNRDPTVKRTIVLQRRTAPTFDALLDYLSQILQFPVLKLYSADGRRVDGLAALILCSGVVVAAGNEPFRLGNYNFHGTGQIAQILFVENVEASASQSRIPIPTTEKNKSFSSGRGSRNFSLSSERFIVNQINKYQNGSLSGCLHHPSGTSETEAGQRHTSMETFESGRGDNEHSACIVPHEDDIEKSFCVNPDGSMTVEMKVRLTVKEEEMLHWTTTLSRSSLNRRTVCASGSGNNSPDSNNTIAKDPSNIQEDERKEENCHDGAISFTDEGICESFTSTTLGKTKTRLKRTPTPGPRHVNKRASVENVKVVTETGVQESTMGHYSYMERTEDGETTEEYCIVRHSSSSSSRPVPKPRKIESSGASNKRSSTRTSGVAEVLQIQNSGMEVTETVMHIYESQGCYDNYFANEEYSADGASLHGSPPVAESKPSTDSRPRSSSNDCDIDCNWQPPTAESLKRQKEEMLSLSSEPESLTRHDTNNPSPATETEAVKPQNTKKVNTDNVQKGIKKKKLPRPAGNPTSSASTSSTDKKHKEISSSKRSKNSSTDKLSSDASVGRKSLNSSEKSKGGPKSKGAETSVTKKLIKDEKDSALLLLSENVKTMPLQRKSTNKAAAKNNGHNVNSPTNRPQMKKNMSDILQTKKSPSSSTKAISRPKSLIECRLSPPKLNVELSESCSIPSLNLSPSEIHQYVENWLEKVSPDSVPYTEELITGGAEPRTKVVFKLGDDSESEEITERQSNVNDAMKKSSSCLSVPLFHKEPATSLLHGEQRARGLCVSMPSVRAEPLTHENRLRLHKSAEAIGLEDSEMSSSNLSPKDKMKPVLRQLCSSIQCIRRTSDASPSLQNSNSLPNFSTQVASVFGSSCKAFLSFLSVMTLRDNLKHSLPGEGDQSRTTSEAMLMMESLQKISVIEDEEKQRASLTDLQSRASSQFREHWKDFQILRERFESEPMSPRVSETEFALDVVSEGGDLFEDQNLGIDELMEELNMPQDLREEIASTIQHAKSFYPVEESTFVETIKNESDSEEDVEQFISEYKDEIHFSPELDNAAGVIAETEQGKNESDEAQEFHTETEKPSKDVEVEEENLKEIDEKKEGEEWETEGEKKGDMEKEGKNENHEESEEEKISDIESVEKVEEGTEEETTEDEEVTMIRLEERDEKDEKKDERVADEETGNEDSVEDTDEREGVDETEEEESSEKEEECEAKTLTDESQEEEENCCEDVEDEFIGNGEQEEDDEAETLADNWDEEKENECTVSVEKDENSEEDNEVETLTDESRKDGENPFEDIEVENNVNQEQDEDETESFKDEEEEKGNVCTEEEENSEEEKQHVSESDEAETLSNERKEEEDENSYKEDAEEEVDEMTGGTRKVNDEEQEEENREEDKESVEVVEEDNETTEEDEGKEEERKQLIEEVTVRNITEDEYNEEENESEQKEEKESEKDLDVKCDQVEDRSVQEKESAEEEEVVDELKAEENMTVEEEERASDDENKLNEKPEQVEQPPDEVEEGNGSEHKSSCEEASLEHSSESPSKYSSEEQCEDDKDTETLHESDAGGEDNEGGRNSLSHPVEISQELLDFVNNALQSYSLVFTYDTQGNVKIVPDNARVVLTKQSLIPKARKDSPYGLKCLPSPVTSDLSDYRPETSGSGGYKTQESVDIVSDSGGESSGKTSSFKNHSERKTERTNREQTDSKLPTANSSETLHSSRIKSVKSFGSSDAGTKASKEDLSYFSAASSLKADIEAETQSAQHQPSVDGVLIDQGRWLLKENHLIRKSPPISLGMYGDLDSTSVDTGQENSEDSPPCTKTQHNPLAAISSSELEEMAKPLTPKCTYFNMPHGSDSDPFLDNISDRSAKHDSSSVKGRGFRVSPGVDTSKTWANRNGSLSSFASVEFKIPDRKVHPEGESSAVRQTRRTSNGEQGALQSQDSLESLHLRCGQYCPIL